jgi:hypothetical protein
MPVPCNSLGQAEWGILVGREAEKKRKKKPLRAKESERGTENETFPRDDRATTQ